MLRTLLALIVTCVSTLAIAAEPVYDVVVYGGTSGGVTAAVQVARMGKTAVIIEPGRHLGGLSSGGLGATDIGNKAAIGGIAREFYGRIYQHYANDAAWKYQKRDEYKSPRGVSKADQGTMWTFEPHVAEAIFNQMVREHSIPVVFGERLDRTTGVKKDGTRITAIVMESGKTFLGRMFIDATYEGDLMATAGVSYTVGREANRQYGETLNGVQTRQARYHQFIKKVDPYVKPGDPASGLLPGVHAGGPGEEESGDKRVQAYNFRLCTTDVPENRRPWPKPEGYDPMRYELLLRNFEAGDLRIPWNPVWMPNRKTDTNNNFAFSTDFIGMNYDYPDGDYATRERIIKEHEDYHKGLMWTLANHPRVPEQVRAEFQRLGLAKDEFVDNDNWPHQLYVREARRMVSDYVMTEHNCVGDVIAPDSVGLGAYGMDSHHTQRYVSPEGYAINEGDVQVHGFSPYPISYRSIVPKRDECSNLLVPVCLSASHISFGSIRMEPVFMILGQSAATAAVQAIREAVDVQAVDYATLRKQLLADRQTLEWTGPRGRVAVSLDPRSLEGVVVDDGKAILTGEWHTSASIGPFVGAGYLHDQRQGPKAARFEVRLPKAGRYEVRLSYSPSGNRATNVPVTIQDATGQHTLTVNQRVAPPVAKAFVSLGVFTFQPDQPAVVTISNQGADGHVVVDAVQFVGGR